MDNESKVDKSQKDNIKFIIAGKNAAKSFETAEEPLDLITLFVQLLTIVPRIFAIAFWRNDRYIAEFLRQSPRLVPFIGSVHQKSGSSRIRTSGRTQSRDDRFPAHLEGEAAVGNRVPQSK